MSVAADRKKQFLVMGVLLTLFAFAVMILLGSLWMFLEMGRKPIEKPGNSDPALIAEERERRERERELVMLERERARRERLLQTVPLASLPWSGEVTLKAATARRLEARTPWHAETLRPVDPTLARTARNPWLVNPQPVALAMSAHPWVRGEVAPALGVSATAAQPFTDERTSVLREVAGVSAAVPWEKKPLPGVEVRAARSPWREVKPAKVEVAAGGVPWVREAAVVELGVVGTAALPWAEPVRKTSSRLTEAALPWTDEAVPKWGIRIHEASVPWLDAEGTPAGGRRSKKKDAVRDD